MRTEQEPIDRNDARERDIPAPSHVADARTAARVFEEAGETETEERLDAERHSLLDDVMTLVEDGKTYAQAELAFQKSRAGFAANRGKMAVAYGAAAFGVLHLALIAITVGMVIALAPLVGPWLATAIVGGILVVIGVFCVSKLKGLVGDIREAFRGDAS